LVNIAKNIKKSRRVYLMAKNIEGMAYAAAGFAAGLFLMWRGFHWFKRKRLIEDIPTSKIRGIAMGLVEVKGKALPAAKEIRKSPLSGKKCVYYRYLVEKLVSTGKSSHWVTVRKGRSPEPFYLKDSTGEVMVDPKYAELNIPKSYTSRSKWGKDPSSVVKNFLKAEKIKFEGFLGMNYTMRYTEWIITPNMELYVMGAASKNPHLEGGTSARGVENIIIKKGADKILMISNKKEKQVLNTLKLKSIGYMSGGFLISLACLAVFIALIRF
jgi:hypothetical protein